MKRIVTMQDLSCIGKCSLTVALPVLSAMGLECAVLPTAVLSAHTAFEGFRYEPLSLTPVADHWQQLGLQFDMIYTGYLGGRAQVDQALDFFTRFPAMRLVDPVMADHGALYAGLEPDFPAVLRTLCAQADLITPNITEACLLTGLEYRETHDDSYIRTLLERLLALGARTRIFLILLAGLPLLVHIIMDLSDYEGFFLFLPELSVLLLMASLLCLAIRLRPAGKGAKP